MSRQQRLIENLGVELSEVFSPFPRTPPTAVKWVNWVRRLLLIVLIAFFLLFKNKNAYTHTKSKVKIVLWFRYVHDKNVNIFN